MFSEIDLGLLLIPGGDSTELLQPVDGPLHQIALPVQGPVEGTGASFVNFPRDGVTNSPRSETGPNPAAAVPFVATYPLGRGDGHSRSVSPPLGSSTLRTRWPRAADPWSARMPPACPDPQLSDGFWSRTLPGNGPAPDRPPPFCTSSVLIRPHSGAVHVMDFPPNLPDGISFPLHLSQKPVPPSLLPPPVETTGYRSPGTKALGQIPPWGAGAQNPQDPVDDRVMIPPRPSGSRLLSRQ